MQLNQQQFFETYNIDKQAYETAEISWDSLFEIHTDYLSYKESLDATAEYLSKMLRTLPAAHTVRSRVKDPEHLIDKIIRKTIREKKENPDYYIDVNNYKSEITDLIGIRVLHLYKDQAAPIDKFIRNTWDLKEKCTIYYRQGDYSKQEEPEDSDLFKFKVHPFGYRSWHYLISSKATKNVHIAEIQVRTIFEEGWSEIDHQLRYPNNMNDVHLTKQLLVLNRVAGSADEMATVIRELVAENNIKQRSFDELKTQLDTLMKDHDIEKAVKEELQEKVARFEEQTALKLPKNQRFNSFINIGEEPLRAPSPRFTSVEKGQVINLKVNDTYDIKDYLRDYTQPILLKNTDPKK
ncbi:RelA/SpoT domain-containing protein [Bacillus mycoides]|uniref:RelA/SpoT domain-containing protein n=1 Tax=Bacillus mycoides TaxID=1405 RepID=UPI00273AEF6F|nr:RelA/SpoT domain-containing protein [Bacillus mycoides]